MQLLYDTFSAFGVIVATPKIMRDPDTGNSKGFGFVSYDCFEASDAAIEAMNGQYLCNRQITVSYAYKKDTKGEATRLGSTLAQCAAGRLLTLQCLCCLWWCWLCGHDDDVCTCFFVQPVYSLARRLSFLRRTRLGMMNWPTASYPVKPSLPCTAQDVMCTATTAYACMDCVLYTVHMLHMAHSIAWLLCLVCARSLTAYAASCEPLDLLPVCR